MRISFSKSVPTINLFSPYWYDEELALKQTYVNLRSIVQENTSLWVEELAKSHIRLCNDAASELTAIWSSSWSRLDLRPWGQEPIVKPFFFALAILEWAKRNTEQSELVIVGAPNSVAHYLKEMSPELEVNFLKPRWSHKDNTWLLLLITSCRAIFRILRNAAKTAWFHLPRTPIQIVKTKNIISYEHIGNTSLQDDHKYYYTSLFDNLNTDNFCFYVTGLVGPAARKKNNPGSLKKFIANDSCTAWDMICATFLELRVLIKSIELIFTIPICSIVGFKSKIFWRNFLIFMAENQSVMSADLARRGLTRLLSKHSFQNIIYPYEEKGVERALLSLTKKNNIRSIGFTPHPQHTLAVSMQDRQTSTCPKPDSYAFCGPIYEKIFKVWGNKTHAQMQVWGTQKGNTENLPKRKEMTGTRAKVLLVLSHPNELCVFGTWLKAEPEICEVVDFTIRRYTSVNPKYFENQLTDIKKHFKNVLDAKGSLRENLEECDAVTFCGTSAGLEAINMGRVSIYLGLNDFFSMNPLFDELKFFLPCHHPSDLLHHLSEYYSLTTQQKSELLFQQQHATAKIFSPINQKNLLATLSGNAI